MKTKEKSSAKLASVKTSASLKQHPTMDEKHALGKSLRDKCSHESHATWQPNKDRPDPLALMEESNKGRMPQLIPIRHGRMLH